MFTLFIKLLLAHFLGDFLFQPYSWVVHKEQYHITSKYLYAHIAVHTILLVVVLFPAYPYWVGVLSILISHFAIDALKARLQTLNNARFLFFTDQVLHLLILFLVAFIYAGSSITLDVVLSNEIVLLILFLVLNTVVASVVMKVIISKWNPVAQEGESLEDAGNYIGILERLFIFVFILLDFWSGIGFLITAKSVFRFGDLSRARDRKLTEYILIGTLLSFGFAILCGLGYTYLVTF